MSSGRRLVVEGRARATTRRMTERRRIAKTRLREVAFWNQTDARASNRTRVTIVRNSMFSVNRSTMVVVNRRRRHRHPRRRWSRQSAPSVSPSVGFPPRRPAATSFVGVASRDGPPKNQSVRSVAPRRHHNPSSGSVISQDSRELLVGRRGTGSVVALDASVREAKRWN